MIAEAAVAGMAGMVLSAVLLVATPAGFADVRSVVPQPRCDAFRSPPGGFWQSKCQDRWLPGFFVPGVVVCDAAGRDVTHCWTRS